MLTNLEIMGNSCTLKICTNGSNFCNGTFFHSDSEKKWGVWGFAQEKVLEIHALHSWKMPFCKIGDLISITCLPLNP